MTLTAEQQLEMYSDIKVIRNTCEFCTEQRKDHEKRIKFLERSYWIFVGISSVITFTLPFIINLFVR